MGREQTPGPPECRARVLDLISAHFATRNLTMKAFYRHIFQLPTHVSFTYLNNSPLARTNLLGYFSFQDIVSDTN
jgi:hypothetical protein